MNTIDASVKFKATPPAFNEMRKTVTLVLFTESISSHPTRNNLLLTEMLNGGISLLRRHTTFKSTYLRHSVLL